MSSWTFQGPRNWQAGLSGLLLFSLALFSFAQPLPDSSRPRRSSAPIATSDLDALWRYLALQPHRFNPQAVAWRRWLLHQGHYTDAAALAILDILRRPYDVWAVAEAQRDLVLALFGRQQYLEALYAAKAYLYQSPLSHHAAAIALLADLLRRVPPDSTLGQILEAERRDGRTTLEDLLPWVPLPPAQLYQPTLQRLRASQSPADPYYYSQLMGQGNLLLLAGCWREARTTFQQAALAASEAQELAWALEGLAKTIRIRSFGSLQPARDFVQTLQRDPAALATELGPVFQELSPADLAQAAAAIPLHPAGPPALPPAQALAQLQRTSMSPPALPTDLPSPQAWTTLGLDIPRWLISQPPTTTNPQWTLPADHPLLLARLAPTADPALRQWLDRWQATFEPSHKTPLPDSQRKTLAALLAHSPLPRTTLLAVLAAFQRISSDHHTSLELALQLLPASESALAQWLQDHLKTITNPDAPFPPPTPQALEQLTSILARSCLSAQQLLELADLLDQALPAPSPLVAHLARAAFQRVHPVLAAAEEFDLSLVPSIQALKHCELLFWRHGVGGKDTNQVLYELARTLTRLVDFDTPQVAWMAGWARITLAESLSALGRPDEALRILESLDPHRLTLDQHAACAVARASVLISQARYKEAAEELRTVVRSLSSTDQRSIVQMMFYQAQVEALIQESSDLTEALHRFETWCRENRVDPAVRKICEVYMLDRSSEGKEIQLSKPLPNVN